MKRLGLEYVKTHTCPNDCILYRNEFKNLYDCPSCRASMWKIREIELKNLAKRCLKRCDSIL